MPAPSALPRRALISLSSFNGAIFPGDAKTGVFVTEALHPFLVLTAAGFEVDFASETGTFGWDEFSQTPAFLVGSDKAVFENPEHPFSVRMRSAVTKASDRDPADYGLFFASAGHAALYDYPTATGLQAIASDVWNRGGIVGAVCHGPALLPGVTDAASGRSIVAGRTATGFTIEGEQLLGLHEKLLDDGTTMIAAAVTAAGGDYSSPIGPFDDYSITSGRLVTGTNPESARSAGERAVMAFQSLGTEDPWILR